jgi:hypothetical protein
MFISLPTRIYLTKERGLSKSSPTGDLTLERESAMNMRNPETNPRTSFGKFANSVAIVTG